MKIGEDLSSQMIGISILFFANFSKTSPSVPPCVPSPAKKSLTL
jgi:hypothetical protein